MNPLDKKLYQLFSIKIREYEQPLPISETTITCSDWSEPQLHDVFRVGEDREIKLGIHNTSEYLYSLHVKTNDRSYYRSYYLSSYNPTLPLLQQENSTKQSIIDLFSN